MPLLTTLQPRDKDVTREDFKALPKILYSSESGHDLSVIYDFWNERTNITPTQVAFIFEELFSKGFLLKIQVLKKGEFRFILEHPEIGRCQRDYDLKGHKVWGSKININHDFQSLGSGSSIRTAFMDLDIALGIRINKFMAGLSSGAFVWAKKGYYLDQSNPAFPDDIPNLSYFLYSKLTALNSVYPIPQSFLDEAMRYSELKQDDHVFHFANLNYDLAPIIDENDFTDSGEIFFSLKNLLEIRQGQDDKKSPLEYTKEKIKRMREAIIFCRQHSRPITLGKLGMMGERFEAYADYDDDQQVSRLLKSHAPLRASNFVVHSHPRKTYSPALTA